MKREALERARAYASIINILWYLRIDWSPPPLWSEWSCIIAGACCLSIIFMLLSILFTEHLFRSTKFKSEDCMRNGDCPSRTCDPYHSLICVVCLLHQKRSYFPRINYVLTSYHRQSELLGNMQASQAHQSHQVHQQHPIPSTANRSRSNRSATYLSGKGMFPLFPILMLFM